MKTYYEVAESVFERGNAIRERDKKIKRTVRTMGGTALGVVLAVTIFSLSGKGWFFFDKEMDTAPFQATAPATEEYDTVTEEEAEVVFEAEASAYPDAEENLLDEMKTSGQSNEAYKQDQTADGNSVNNSAVTSGAEGYDDGTDPGGMEPEPAGAVYSSMKTPENGEVLYAAYLNGVLYGTEAQKESVNCETMPVSILIFRDHDPVTDAQQVEKVREELQKSGYSPETALSSDGVTVIRITATVEELLSLELPEGYGYILKSELDY